jgi:GH43 family beta-xylosidase
MSFATLAADAAGTYKNPVIDDNLADPVVIRHEGNYYLYATGEVDGDNGYRVFTSNDLVNWQRGPVVFRPGQPHIWAPDVWRDPDTGRLYLYYTANGTVGVADAAGPLGPFTIRKRLFDRAIDAHLFRDDDGRLYLYIVQLPGFRIMVQSMAHPTEPVGDPQVVLQPEAEWETRDGRVTEGPWMIKHDGRYYLLYSGSGAQTPDYAVGYATSASPLGPFTRAEHNPILHRSEGLFGPGHGCAIRDQADQWWFVYHQKRTARREWDRFICVDPLRFDNQGRLHGEATRNRTQDAPATGERSVKQLIRAAGNVDDDADRLAILRQLQARSNLDQDLRANLDRLETVVDRWVHEPRLFQWFHRQIREKLDYEFGIAETSPLYPLTHLYRARMLIWTANEYGNIKGYHDVRRRFFDKAVAELRAAAGAFPENRIVRMYLGEPIPPTREYAAMAEAPAWAVAQREGLERLTDIVLWWIDHRFQEDGQYGGGWDDDCEMWRHWVPVMIAFDHPRISEAQERFARALLGQDYMKDGYTSRVYDVEHTAEPSSDTITPMMHLAPDDPQWSGRARRLAELMNTRWTGRNERGFLQFKSTYFSAQRIDDNPTRACDTPYHVRAIEPALVLWLRTGDERLGQLFTSWMDTWVDATHRTDRGKPAGVIPAAIRWPSGETAGPGEHWWDPRHHGEPRLYEWPSAMGKMTDALLLTYHMTGDEKYLAPLRSMAAIRLASLKQTAKNMPPPGSLDWCGRKLGFLSDTLVKYKVLTGKQEFDELLARDGGSLTAAGVRPDDPALAKALQQTAQALSINFPGRTSEVRWTDRVFAFARLFDEDMLFPKPAPPCNHRPNLNLLYATATGDRGKFPVFPLNRVRWLTPPRNIAALVTEQAPDRFSATFYHFGESPRPMGAELYLLKPGEYTLTVVDQAGQPLAAPATVSVEGPRTQVDFRIPPRQPCRLRVLKKSS